MTSTTHRSVDDGHDEKASMKEAVTTYESDVNNLYESDDDSLDPVYYRKTLVLNRAIQEIGMGKYQVSSSCSIVQMDCQHQAVNLVSPLYRRWLRMVCVSVFNLQSRLLSHIRHPRSDSVWPVSPFHLLHFASTRLKLDCLSSWF